MGVIATKTIGSDVLTKEWNCSTFDFMQATQPGNGWVEIARDCDRVVRRTLFPYASGPSYFSDTAALFNEKVRHRKYFPAVDEVNTSTLNLSDVNNGLLPFDFCKWGEVYQNGKKLPCEAFALNASTAVLAINSAWIVPGAAYEVFFWASVYNPTI